MGQAPWRRTLRWWAVLSRDELDEGNSSHGAYGRVGSGGEMEDFVGYLDLPVKCFRARFVERHRAGVLLSLPEAEGTSTIRCAWAP